MSRIGQKVGYWGEKRGVSWDIPTTQHAYTLIISILLNLTKNSY